MNEWRNDALALNVASNMCACVSNENKKLRTDRAIHYFIFHILRPPKDK